MKKKLLGIMLMVSLAAGITACGSGKSNDAVATEAPRAEETTKAESAPEETTEEEITEEETTEAPKTEGTQFQTGTWDGLVFTNPWLGLKITFPEEAYIFTEDEMKSVLGAGQDILVNNGNYTESQLTMAEALTVYDFMVSLPDGQSNVQMAYENIKLTTGGKGIEPKEYLEIVFSNLESIKDMQYEMGEMTEVEIGGKTFAKLPASLMGGAALQEYYSTRIGDHMATMTFTFVEDSAAVIEEIVAGIEAAE